MLLLQEDQSLHVRIYNVCFTCVIHGIIQLNNTAMAE